MWNFLIIRGGAVASGWYTTWFAHGLADGLVLIEEDLTPMFNAAQRVAVIEAQKRKVS